MALTAEQIAASTYFDADAYVEAKARIMVLNGKANSQEDARTQFLSNWTGDMSEHYLNYGAAENVNPSNDFDNSDYIAQVAAAEGVTYQALKADWEAQGIAPLEHFIETGEGLGYTAPPVSADEQVDVGDTPVVEGDDIRLTSDTDRDGIFDGTSGDDAFDAPIVQNQWAGGVSNSLSTADRLDGGAGSDSLYAELVPEFYGVTGDNQMDVQPRIQSIEDIQFEAMDVSSDSIGADNDAVITIDAKNITDVDHIGSAYSDGDLLIENLTTLTNDGTIRNTNTITITMDHTDNFNSDTDASDLTVYFDEDYLNTTTETQGSQLTINMINTLNNKLNEVNADSALSLIEGFDMFTFSVGETEVEVNVTGAELSEVKGLIETALTDAGIDTVTVTEYLEPAFFATNIYYEDTGTTFNAGDPAGPDYTAFVLTNSASDEMIEGGFDLADGSRDGSLAYSQDDRPPQIEDLPISINVELEKVGRDGEGGNLVIGGKDQNSQLDVDVDQNDGIEIFDITVLGGEDKPSNLGIISSTNGTLTTVDIDSAQSENDTWADLTVRTRLGQGQELTLIDSTDFEGDFALGLSVLDNDGDGVLETVVTGVQQALTSNFGSGDDSYNWASVEADVNDDDGKDYSISMGAGDDTVVASLDGDSVDALGESFNLLTGSGDDVVTVDMTAGVSYRTMAEIGDDQDTYLDINTGDGADRVFLDDYGTFDIVTGSGDDYIEIDADDSDDLSGDWAIFNNTGIDTFTARVLYNAQMTVSFAGFETTIKINTTSADNYVATQELIASEIQRAIESDDTLSEFLTVNIAAGTNQVTITSDIDGANVLGIALFQPELISTGTATASQTLIQSNDVSYLRKGLLETEKDAVPTLDSEDLEDAAEISDWVGANNWEGSVDQTGLGDNDTTYTAAQLTNDTAETIQDDAGADADLLDQADFLAYTTGNVTASANDTDVVNFSTINAGSGDDIIVLDSNVGSMNTIVVDAAFGYDRVVNFFDDTTDITDDAANEVGDHIIDYSHYLTDLVDTSDASAGNNDNNDSAVLADTNVILSTGARSFTGTAHGAAAGVEIDANDVAVIRFDSSVADDDTETFANLSASDVLNALNGDYDATGDNAYANLADGIMSAVAVADYVNATQNHIIMIENDLNEGEYKVYHATSTIDTTTDVVTDGDFATVTELGTFDFGASVNLAISQEESVMTVLQNAILAADGVDPSIAPVAVDDTFTVDLDAPVLLDVLANDTDADTAQEDLVIAGVQAIDAAQGTVVVQDNQILFDPADGFTGDVTFAYGVSDGTDTDQGSVTVTVEEVVVTQPPVPVDDEFTVAMDAPTLLDVLANDTDADTAQEDLVIAGVQAIDAAQGTVAVQDNQILFDPADGFTGDVTFAYGVSDGTDTRQGSVTVTVADGSTIDLIEGTSDPVPATDDADTFTFDAVAALALTDNTQIQITDFDTAADSLVLDIETAGGVDSLDDLDGIDGISVFSSGITQITTINFGNDADGDVVALQLVGVTDATLVQIEAV